MYAVWYFIVRMMYALGSIKAQAWLAREPSGYRDVASMAGRQGVLFPSQGSGVTDVTRDVPFRGSKNAPESPP